MSSLTQVLESVVRYVLTVVCIVAIGLWVRGAVYPIFTFFAAIAFCIFWTLQAGGLTPAHTAAQPGLSRSHVYLSGLVLLIIAVLSHLVIPYASLWGDVGVYINVADFLADGGLIPFEFQTVMFDLKSREIISAPIGMINPAGNEKNAFHGLPTWPGVMAIVSVLSQGLLSASVLLAAVSVGIFYALLREVSVPKNSALVGAVIFAVNPLFIFQATYLTAEMLSLTIVLSAALLVSHRISPKIVLFMAGFAFGAVHPSIVILVPILSVSGFLFLCLVPECSRRKGLIAALALSFGSLASYFYAADISSSYHSNIIAGLFGGREVFAYLALLSPVIGILALVGLESTRRGRLAIRRAGGMLVDRYNVLASVALVIVGLILLVQTYYFGWTDAFIPEVHNAYSSWSARATYANKGLGSLWHLSIVNIALASALIGLLGFLLFPFSDQRNSPLLISLWVAVFCLLLVFGVYRIDIPNNFYASRYFFPHLMPGLFVFGAFLLARRKWVCFGLVPIWILFSVIVVVQFANGRFFATDSQLNKFFQSYIDFERDIFVSGDPWLHSHLHGFVLRNHKEVEYFSSIKRMSHEATALLVTNADHVVLGSGSCLSFVERRIPWSISYFQSPQLNDRSVCQYDQWSETQYSSDKRGNSWISRGQLEFVLMGSGEAGPVNVVVESYGWWAGKAPFMYDPSLISPSLSVCGESFELIELSPRKIEFSGNMPSGPCLAVFESATFIPAEIGEGPDTRSLGMDVSKIRVIQLE